MYFYLDLQAISKSAIKHKEESKQKRFMLKAGELFFLVWFAHI